MVAKADHRRIIVAAPAATVVRHYHVSVPGGHVGQSAEHQLNLIAGLLQEVQGSYSIREIAMPGVWV